MLQRFLLLWLTLLSLIAFYWPSFGIEFDPFGWSKSYLAHLFAATMFAIGCLLQRDEVRQVFARWPTVLGGTVIQYTVMPLLAFIIARMFGLQGGLFIGVVMVGCVPGAMASNVLTLTARGNISYSVSLTTSATLMSPFVVPGILYLAVQGSDIDEIKINRINMAVDAFKLLMIQVACPVVAGHLISSRLSGFAAVMKKQGPVLANLSILWIIAVVVGINRDKLAGVSLQLAAILLLINLVGYSAGYAGAKVLRLPGSMRRALTLEVGMQNAGMGAVLATQLFGDDKIIALPPALYTFGCMLTGTILAQVWSRFCSDELGEQPVTDN